MYKFNNDHIATSHIKELLHNFHLPMCSVFKDGTLIKNYKLDEIRKRLHDKF